MKFLSKKVLCVVTCILSFTGISLMADVNNVLNFIPKSCNIVGNVNLKEIKTIKSVNDAINKTQNDPIYLCLKAAGLTADNINDITYGMSMQKMNQKKPSFIALLQTEQKTDLQKFIKDSTAQDKNIVITSEKSDNGKDIYKYVNKQDKKQDPVYCVAVNDNTVALGTEDFIKDCSHSTGSKDTSVLSNADMMKLVSDENRDDMVWVAAIIPDDFNKANQKDSKLPNIKNGILAFNYKESALTLSGQINCATPQDVQKVMLPIQMFLGIFAMNPDTGIDPQDISLKPDGNSLAVNIKVPEKAINAILKTQEQAANQEAAALNANPTDSKTTPATEAPITTPANTK